MNSNFRTRNGQPINFINGLKVKGVDIEELIQSTTNGPLLATGLETQQGTNNTKAVSPAGLKTVTDTLATKTFVQNAINAATNTSPASTSVAGTVTLATIDDVVTGTDNSKAITPAVLKSVIDTLVTRIEFLENHLNSNG